MATTDEVVQIQMGTLLEGYYPKTKDRKVSLLEFF
jgi:hypothetical protein